MGRSTKPISPSDLYLTKSPTRTDYLQPASANPEASAIDKQHSIIRLTSLDVNYDANPAKSMFDQVTDFH